MQIFKSAEWAFVQCFVCSLVIGFALGAVYLSNITNWWMISASILFSVLNLTSAYKNIKKAEWKNN